MGQRIRKGTTGELKEMQRDKTIIEQMDRRNQEAKGTNWTKENKLDKRDQEAKRDKLDTKEKQGK